MRTTTHGATMSPRMERLWAFIRDEQRINLCDFSTDDDVERNQKALRAGEEILVARLAEACENRQGKYAERDVRDLEHLLADYRTIMNRRPRERTDAATLRSEAEARRVRGEVESRDEIADMVKGRR